MNEAYLIAASTGQIQSLSSRSHADQVRPVLDDLLEKTGLPSRELEEMHWIGREDDYWLGSLDVQGGQPGRFQWPSSPLLAHFVLQACGRAIESGERSLLLVAQETGGQVVLMLLASGAAAGQHNLSPSARIGPRLSLRGGESSLLAAARAALEKSGLEPGQVEWLAAGRQLAASAGSPVFPSGRWLRPGSDLPGGDLFLFNALAGRLEKEKLGLLLSQGPQQTGLGTLLEKV